MKLSKTSVIRGQIGAEHAQGQQKSSESLMRQWRILRLLPTKGSGITVTKLLAKLEGDFKVSRRTIERDLQTLTLLFPISCNEKSKPFGWTRPPDMQLSEITLPEALLLYLAAPQLANVLPASIRPLLSPRLAEAEQVIQKTAQSQRWCLAEKIAFLPTPQLQQTPEVDAEVLFTVQSALLDEYCVDIHYSSPYRLLRESSAITSRAQTTSAGQTATLSQAPPPTQEDTPHTTASKYLLHPLALVQNGMQLYLVAVVDGYQDIRLFAMQRISAAQVAEKPAERPADFKLQPYLQSGALQFVSEPAPFTLCARIDTTLANLLAEAPLGTQMCLEQAAEPGWWQLTTEISDSWNLRLWLQSQGSRVEVISPLWLRQQLQQELQRTLALYQR